VVDYSLWDYFGSWVRFGFEVFLLLLAGVISFLLGGTENELLKAENELLKAENELLKAENESFPQSFATFSVYLQARI
jgi:hypothetical protein